MARKTKSEDSPNGFRHSRDSIKNIWGSAHRIAQNGRKELMNTLSRNWIPGYSLHACCVPRAARWISVSRMAGSSVCAGAGWIGSTAAGSALLRRDGNFEPASWDEAMDFIVAKTKEIKEKYTGRAIGVLHKGRRRRVCSNNSV